MPTSCPSVSATVKLSIGMLIHIPGFLVDRTVLKGTYRLLRSVHFPSDEAWNLHHDS